MRPILTLSCLVVAAACSSSPAGPFDHVEPPAPSVPELWCFVSADEGAFPECDGLALAQSGELLRTRMKCITTRDARVEQFPATRYLPCQRAASPHCFSSGSPGDPFFYTGCAPTLVDCVRARDTQVRRTDLGRQTVTPCDPMQDSTVGHRANPGAHP